MKRSTFIKLAILVVLGVCSSWLTSSILAQTRTSKAPIVSFRKSDATGRAGGNFVPPQGEVVNPLILASSHLDDISITSQAGRMSVSARSTLSDSTQQYSYMWSLLIANNEKPKQILDLNYDEQLFTILPGNVLNPKFDESLNLSPGKYRIELRLYRISEATDIAGLKDLGSPNPSIVLSSVKEITVGG